jgi:hypothetical protein
MNVYPPRLSLDNSFPQMFPPRGGAVDSALNTGARMFNASQAANEQRMESTIKGIADSIPRSVVDNFAQGAHNFERGSRNAVRFYEGLNHAASTPQGQYGLRMLPGLVASSAMSPMSAPGLFKGVENNMRSLKDSHFRGQFRNRTPAWPPAPTPGYLNWHPPMTGYEGY